MYVRDGNINRGCYVQLAKCDKVCGWCSESWHTVQHRGIYTWQTSEHVSHTASGGSLGDRITVLMWFSFIHLDLHTAEHDGVAIAISGDMLIAAVIAVRVPPPRTVPIGYTSYRPDLLWYLPASTGRKTSFYMLLIQTLPSAPYSHSHLITRHHHLTEALLVFMWSSGWNSRAGYLQYGCATNAHVTFNIKGEKNKILLEFTYCLDVPSLL